MTTRILFLSGMILFLLPGSFSQKLKKADKAVVASLQSHIRFLADDKLEGRRAGTPGEKMAREYISNQFASIGLQSKGENGWYQPFEIYDGKEVQANSFLIINGHDLKLFDEYFPFPWSASQTTEAAVSIALPESGVPWFMDLKETMEENRNNPHFDISQAIRNRADQAAGKGATALIIFNSASGDEDLAYQAKDRMETAAIPVLYVLKNARSKYLNDPAAVFDMKLKVNIGDKKRTGNNVIGYIDNHASSTVVIGAHYDHLGYGEDGNSMLRTGEKLVHNGADDNASGTAALIELARILKKSKNRNNNYLFIAFSAEELGLNGSKYFTEHPSIDLSKVNYMINMDMVGRLNDSSRTLTVGGYGTSPEWGSLFAKNNGSNYFRLKFDSSGTGPSDHTSFYRKDIPVLFFFTGLHGDYHRPTDDYDKINYTGELQVVKYVASIVQEENSRGKLTFTKTRESSTSSSSTRLRGVTMGIMPDYTYSGSGIRIDGVTDGRPAQKAGLKAGDIILQLGDFNTNSMEQYMQALNSFKKGDKARLKYKRGEETLESEVQF